MSDQPLRPHYPQRLHHGVPSWVKSGARFHIRIRAAGTNSQLSLVSKNVGSGILTSAQHYHESGRWHLTLILVMPDHVHALVSFPFDSQMTRTVGDWKRYTARALGVSWQTNFFDHRIRSESEGAETFAYIMRNPIAKGLIGENEPWPWMWHPA